MKGESMPVDRLYDRTRESQKIVVVDLGFLGDTVHLVPALVAIHRNYSKAQIHVVTTPLGGAVVSMVRCVHRIWTLEMDAKRRTWTEQASVIRGLRAERFDLAVNFTGADRTLILTALTGARWRLARVPDRWHFWSPWLIRYWVPQPDRTLPVFEQRLQVLAAAGLDPATAQFGWSIPREALLWAEAKVPNGAVHFSLSASTPLKEWPLTRWIALGKRFLDEEGTLELVVTGGQNPREQNRLEVFQSSLGSGRVQILIGLSIPRLAAVLQRCRLHVGCDSGPLHLAAAMGTPTLALFRQYPEMQEWLPRGFEHRHLSVPCACIGQRRPGCAGHESSACLAGLSESEVFEALMSTLRRV